VCVSVIAQDTTTATSVSVATHRISRHLHCIPLKREVRRTAASFAACNVYSKTCIKHQRNHGSHV